MAQEHIESPGPVDEKEIAEVNGSHSDAVDESTTPSEAPASPASSAADTTSLTSPASREGLKRTSGKIANLRSAFEKSHGLPSPSTPRFDRTPALNKNSDAETTRLKEKQALEIKGLKEEHHAEITMLKDQHEHDISALRETLANESKLLCEVEDRCGSLQKELEELQEQATRQASEWNAELERRSTSLRREKEDAREQVSTVQQQLVELKRSISSATRIENQVSDSTFTLELQNLYHETQNWIVNNFRRAKIETPEAMVSRLESIAEPKQLDYLRPIYQELDPSNKISALQTTTMCYIMEIWEEPLLFGMPQQDWRRSLKKAAETLPSVIPTAAFNRWRANTLDELRQSDVVKQSVESAEASLAEMICITLNTLTDIETSETQTNSLIAIVKRAVSLSHLFKIQRARYDFKLPSPGETFTAETMEDIMLDGKSPNGRAIQCATFPAVIKIGDEHGDTDVTNVIVKAKVICNG